MNRTNYQNDLNALNCGQKWDELNALNLNGYHCFLKDEAKKMYHFNKPVQGGKWAYIKVKFKNFSSIEFMLEHGFSDK